MDFICLQANSPFLLILTILNKYTINKIKSNEKINIIFQE